jgi:excisionase family DNA binding protein
VTFLNYGSKNMTELILLSISKEELQNLFAETIRKFQLLSQPIEVKDNKIERLFSIPDLCKLFGVSRITINEWKKSGKLIYHRIGGRIYFKEVDVLNAMQKIDFSNRKGFVENIKGAGK